MLDLSLYGLTESQNEMDLYSHRAHFWEASGLPRKPTKLRRRPSHKVEDKRKCTQDLEIVMIYKSYDSWPLNVDDIAFYTKSRWETKHVDHS